MTRPDDVADEQDARDRSLLAAHVAGDPEAFGELARRHGDRLFAVAVRTLGDRDEAADAVQDALINAYRRADSYRGESRVTTWLHRVVVNACLDRLRRKAVRATVPLPETGPGEPAAPGDALADRETSLDVQAALALLPPEQRAAIVLVDLMGLPVEEASRVLEAPVGTVKSRCFRGRARLAVSLGHLAPGAGQGPEPGRNRPDPASVRPTGHPPDDHLQDDHTPDDHSPAEEVT